MSLQHPLLSFDKDPLSEVDVCEVAMPDGAVLAPMSDEQRNELLARMGRTMYIKGP